MARKKRSFEVVNGFRLEPTYDEDGTLDGLLLYTPDVEITYASSSELIEFAERLEKFDLVEKIVLVDKH
jgi:predicted GNAT superfamily acetyltransferase